MDERYFQAKQRAVLREHFDANETMFLERELTQLRAKMYEVQFPELRARNFAPKASDISPSAETFSYKVLEPVGRAKFISYKAGDLPRVDVIAREVLGKVRPLGASFGWDLNELRRAAELNTPLPEVKARIARETVERQIDEVLAFGGMLDDTGNRPAVGLDGIVNNADVVAQGIVSGSYWFGGAVAGPALLAELASDVSNIATNSHQVFRANTLLLPVRHFNYIAQTPYGTFTGDSILKYLLENNPGLDVQPWYQLDAAGAAGKPRGIVYQKDPSILESVIPQEFETLPPRWVGLEALNDCHARCGGVKVYQPLAMKYVDFLTS